VFWRVERTEKGVPQRGGSEDDAGAISWLVIQTSFQWVTTEACRTTCLWAGGDMDAATAAAQLAAPAAQLPNLGTPTQLPGGARGEE
jgi:hypothetical protein